MNYPKVSIIIPCYNAEEYIERAIASVYAEEYPSVELIVVDDGSTDGSKDLILSWEERFCAKKWELRYVFQENKGPGGAINTALKYVSGEYLSLLDADDEYLPGSISKRAAFLQENPDVDVVRSNGWIVKGEHRRLFVLGEKERQCTDIFVPLLRGETNNWAGSYMMKTEALFVFYPNKEIYTSRYGQNLQLLLPLAYKKRCGFIDQPLMNYIQRSDSVSQVSNPKESLRKNMENAAGYKDVRIHMLQRIVNDKKRFDLYMRQIDAGYWKGILRIAGSHHVNELLREAYRKLKVLEKPSWDDAMVYYHEVCPPVTILLRVWKKLLRWIGKTDD